MKRKNYLSLGMAAVMAVSAIGLSGCGKEENDGKLTYWSEFYSHYSNVGTNMGEAPFFKELQERTGVEIEFIHPAPGDVQTNFNLMAQPGSDMPDLIEYSMLSYKGGPEKAIDDGVIVEISPEDLETKAPNLAKVLKEHPEWDKQVKTDSGKYYCFPALRGDDSLDYWKGPQIRKDYLDKVGMDAPETIADWEAVLTAFKEQLGVEMPLTFKYQGAYDNSFVGAYGITNSFFLKDGKVTFGPMTEEYTDFIKLFNDWVSKGLIDPDYATHNQQTVDTQLSSGKSAAYVGSVGGDMGKYISASKMSDPDAEWIAVKPPVLNEGDEPTIGFKDFDYIPGQSVSITTNCKDVDAAFKLLDYAYSEEGHMFYNFGVEGVSYNMVDGYPTYVDSIVHPTDGSTVQQALTEYTRAAVMGPMVQDKRYFEQYMVNPEQKATAEAWKLAGDASWRMPNVTYTVEESRDITSKLNDITNYVNEMEIKFILGVEPISNIDTFRKTLEEKGIEDVINIMQAAVDRYNAR